jgi:hypothetical protein
MAAKSQQDEIIAQQTRVAHQHLRNQQLHQHFHQHHRYEQAIRAHLTPEPTPRLLYRCHTFIHTGRLVWWQKTRTCVYERVQCTSCTSNTKPRRSDLQCSSEGVPQRPVHCLAVGRVISTRLPTTTGNSNGLQIYGQYQSAQSPHGIASEEGQQHGFISCR